MTRIIADQERGGKADRRASLERRVTDRRITDALVFDAWLKSGDMNRRSGLDRRTGTDRRLGLRNP